MAWINSVQMTLNRRLAGLLLAVLALPGCEPPPVQQIRLQHFGTEIEIKLPDASEAQARETFARMDAKLGDWHRRWHAWQPSELAALNNALSNGETVLISADLAGLLRRSQRFSAETDGLFNPGLGHRLADWGFQRADPTAAAPSPLAIDPKRLPRMSAMSLGDDNAISSSDVSLQLDLGGIAKGYALNALLEDLQVSHVGGAFINLGGDIGVLGDFRGRPWKIGVLAGPQQVIGALELSDGEQAFSSGIYARQHPSSDSGNAHHILDPRTGNPAIGNRAATVIGRDGERLQVASKVLLIAGSDWRHHADALATPLALVVNAEGVIEVTEALAVRLEADSAERAKWRVVK